MALEDSKVAGTNKLAVVVVILLELIGPGAEVALEGGSGAGYCFLSAIVTYIGSEALRRGAIAGGAEGALGPATPLEVLPMAAGGVEGPVAVEAGAVARLFSFCSLRSFISALNCWLKILQSAPEGAGCGLGAG